jgi:hypothetical protein
MRMDDVAVGIVGGSAVAQNRLGRCPGGLLNLDNAVVVAGVGEVGLGIDRGGLRLCVRRAGSARLGVGRLIVG